jgi:hypothetical protein
MVGGGLEERGPPGDHVGRALAEESEKDKGQFDVLAHGSSSEQGRPGIGHGGSTDESVLGGDPRRQLETFGEQLVGHQEGVALIGPGNTEVTAPGMDRGQEFGHPVLTPVGRGPQPVGGADLVRLADGYVARLCHLSSVPATAGSASRASAFPGSAWTRP